MSHSTIVSSPASRALVHVDDSSAFFFRHSDALYSYWYRRSTEKRAGKLSLRIRRDRLEAFRATRDGRQLEKLVHFTFHKQGWVLITARESLRGIAADQQTVAGLRREWFLLLAHDSVKALNEKTGIAHDALKLWLRLFNLFNKAGDFTSSSRLSFERIKHERSIRVQPSQQIMVAKPAIESKLEQLARMFPGANRRQPVTA